MLGNIEKIALTPDVEIVPQVKPNRKAKAAKIPEAPPRGTGRRTSGKSGGHEDEARQASGLQE